MRWMFLTTTSTSGMSEDLKGAIVGAILTFILTGIYTFFRNIKGRVHVKVLRKGSYIKERRDDGSIKKIEICANVLCENTKYDMVSLYDWRVVVKTDYGKYLFQLDNLSSDNKFSFLDVISLNHNEAVQIVLETKIDTELYKTISYKDIEKIKKIEKIEIKYRKCGKKKTYKAK